MISTYEALTGEKKNYTISCTKCDFSINYLKRTKWYVERSLEFYKSLPWSPDAECKHELEIKEI